MKSKGLGRGKRGEKNALGEGKGGGVAEGSKWSWPTTLRKNVPKMRLK